MPGLQSFSDVSGHGCMAVAWGQKGLRHGYVGQQYLCLQGPDRRFCSDPSSSLPRLNVALCPLVLW